LSVTVGVIANPASGRDIRRLVAGASVFDNTEKGNMVYRLMVGLKVAGVERVLMMPAASGLSDSLERNLQSNAAKSEGQPLPELELVEMTVRHSSHDTVEAVGTMIRRGVSAIVVLGGDGTNRIVARHCSDVPICTLSTGTNNAFPRMREPTVAGLATGLVATRQVDDNALRREKILRVGLNGKADHDCALVDVAVSVERFVGARALWKARDISEVFVTSAAPDAVGLSAVAGLLDPIPRSVRYGLHIRLTDPEVADTVLTAPLAPGLVVAFGVAQTKRIEPGKVVYPASTSGSLALDGEREIELSSEDRVEVRLDVDGPLTIDVEEVMQEAAWRGLLSSLAYPSR
jgi:predicted polyphosphate/ATP-dependent NAD kinase